MAFIRPMRREDTSEVLRMMRVFYDSTAVLIHSSDATLMKDVESAVGDCPYLDGWVFVEQDRLCGYAMCAKSYSTEAGGVCVWIEDLYLCPEARGQGLAKAFFRMAHQHYNGAARFRLEAEAGNDRAMRLYQALGYRALPYTQMIRDCMQPEREDTL